MTNLIEWRDDEENAPEVNGWIGDVPFFRLSPLSDRWRIYVLTHLGGIGPRTEGEPFSQELFCYGVFDLQTAKDKATEWAFMFFTRMKLVHRPAAEWLITCRRADGGVLDLSGAVPGDVGSIFIRRELEK